ncbi:hypothetical protein MMC16_001905 [Acarospora aff. strigata]|nr:hypothetical protein [Acarospora aff. strigata]
MSIDWYHRIASKFSCAPPTSPVTSLVHLTCDSSIDLLNPSTPQGKTFDEIRDALLENASHSPEKLDRILRATEVDRPEHVILFINWSDQPPSDFLTDTVPIVFKPINQVAKVSVSNVAFDHPPHFRLGVHWSWGYRTPVELMTWTLPAQHDETIFAAAFEAIANFFLMLDCREAHEEPGDLVTVHRGWNLSPNAGTHTLLLGWKDQASELRFKDSNAPSTDANPDSYEADFLKPFRDMQSHGLISQSYHILFREWFPKETSI